MVIDWLAAGLDPEKATIFIQSRLPEHAELFTLLAMGTPLGWLERMPTYKDQIEKLKDRDLATYGFLGYPLLQAADILIYKASHVPVGEDQAPHVEITREVARRFNHLYGRAPDHEPRSTPRSRCWPRTMRVTWRSSARPTARTAMPRRWPRARRWCASCRPPARSTTTRPNCCWAT
jgi:tryptophanyl-tRNA synthetase